MPSLSFCSIPNDFVDLRYCKGSDRPTTSRGSIKAIKKLKAGIHSLGLLYAKEFRILVTSIGSRIGLALAKTL